MLLDRPLVTPLLKVPTFIRAAVIFIAYAGLCLKGSGQVNAQLQAVDSHFAGAWVGMNHDYTKTPMVSNPVRIEIRDNPKKGELRLEYTYWIKGQKGYDHLVRFMAIKPARSTVEFNWQHESKESYTVSGLDALLNTGFGEFTCAGTVHTSGKDIAYRCVFHIEVDRFNYSWEKSDDGVTFSKSGDWTLKRESLQVGSTSQP